MGARNAKKKKKKTFAQTPPPRKLQKMPRRRIRECPSLMPEDYFNSEDLFLQWRDNTVYVASLYANGMLEDECAARYGLPAAGNSTPCERARALQDFVHESFPGQDISRQVCRGRPACMLDLGEIRLWRELDCVTEQCERARFGCGGGRSRYRYPFRRRRFRRRFA